MTAPQMRKPGGSPTNAEQQKEHLDSVTAESKADATLVALAAMRGFEVRKLDGGAWLISRWCLSKEPSDRPAAADFLRRAGVTV